MTPPTDRGASSAWGRGGRGGSPGIFLRGGFLQIKIKDVKTQKSNKRKNFGDTTAAGVPLPQSGWGASPWVLSVRGPLVATMTREQETRCQGCGGAFMKRTVNPRDSNGCEWGDPNRPLFNRAGQYCWQCEAARNHQVRCDGTVQENGGHGDKPNTLAPASQIMSPVSYFGFIFTPNRGSVFSILCPPV
jgi:hypothetical protein